MKSSFIFLHFLIALILFSCENRSVASEASQLTDSSKAEPQKEIACKLTSKELQERKATVLQLLKNAVKEKKELPNGYSFSFDGSSERFDQLTEFIRSERQCCGFFEFNIKVSDVESDLWLDITGPEGAKEMIIDEMGL